LSPQQLLGWRRRLRDAEAASAEAGGLKFVPDSEPLLAALVSKGGNKPNPVMMVELAWCWLRYQPQSDLAKWYRRRFAERAGCSRKVGVIALARKLAVALCVFWNTDWCPSEPILRPSDKDSAADGQLKGVALAVRIDPILCKWCFCAGPHGAKSHGGTSKADS
jgi:hypothetical protein